MPVSRAQRLQAVARVQREIAGTGSCCGACATAGIRAGTAGPSAIAADRRAAGTAAARPPGPATCRIFAGASGFAHGSAYDAEIWPPLANDVSSAAPGVPVDHGDFVAVVGEVPRRGDADDARAEDDDPHQAVAGFRRAGPARCRQPECSCRTGCGRRTRCRRARPAASTSPLAATPDGYAADAARVAVRPGVGGDRRRGVRRMLQRIVGAVHVAFLDRADLVADRDHRVDEAVELGFDFALGRLDHQRAGDRKAHRRRVEAVVDQALGDVLGLDARRGLERPQVEDAFVRDEAARPRVEHRIVRREAARDVVGVRGSRVSVAARGPSPPIIVTYIHEIGRIDALPYGAARRPGPIGVRCALVRPARCARVPAAGTARDAP